MEGEGEEEKREWEELSEKACMLVRMMEKMKNRREGKKSGTLKMMKKEKEEMEQNLEAERRGREEEKRKLEEEKKKREEAEREKREAEERIEQLREEIEEIKKKRIVHTPAPSNTPPIASSVISVITSLDGTSVTFPQTDSIKRERNTIVHHGFNSNRNCFIGGEMTSV